IACLVFSIAKRRDLAQFDAVRGYVISQRNEDSRYPEYARYYVAQALYQVDEETWRDWNRSLVRQLRSAQAADGSFSGEYGQHVSTSLNLLALALNFRFLPIYE